MHDQDGLRNAASDGPQFQKKTTRAAEQDRPDVVEQRADWHATQTTIAPESLVFLDETSVKTDITRLRGWGPTGERILEATPGGHWKTCTLVHAISLDGTRAAMVLDGPVNGPSFTGFCEWLLAPSLNSGDYVIMDNLSTHKSAAAVNAIESVGASAVYLPPYSPDLNPIENIFSKLKQLVRALRPRYLKQIVTAVAHALRQITLDDISAVFEHAGYHSHA